MKTLLGLSMLAAFALASARPSESKHIHGPHGLDGWTRNYDIPGQGKLPTTLVLARNGHVFRRISGDPFVWEWMFQADGEQLAYESGPLHFSMQCILIDTKTGKRMADYDCFSDPLAADAPDWVRALKSSHKTGFGN